MLVGCPLRCAQMPGDRHGFIPSSAEDVLRRRVKAELRKRMRALRKTLPATACGERSARIVERLSSLDVISGARAVALFWPIEERHEVDLRPLDAALRLRGARVAYPAVVDDGRAMVFRFVAEASALVDGPMGLREPPAGAPVAAPGDLDAIVVPALAIDPRGHRIGYGAGYYDRALPSMSPPAVSVGVVYEFQLLAEIPETEGDRPVDWIVTDARAERAEPPLPARPTAPTR
jgi:5-formyltetrahydrofolate cyclo-ligase